ncbi:hypothetical protein [Thiocapsa imhoffii]|nr:hypothetical protein [Thiocapsa imhoffii]
MLYATRLSADGPLAKTFEAHAVDVLRAALSLFVEHSSHPSPLGEAWMRFFRIPPERWPVLRLNLIAGALLKDIGKASVSHQEAVLHGRASATPLRHEQISALILSRPAFRDWLAMNPLLRPDCLISAIAAHRLKPLNLSRTGRCDAQETAHGVREPGCLVVGRPETLRNFFDYVSNYLDLPKAPTVPTLWTWDHRRGTDLNQAVAALEKTILKTPTECEPILSALTMALIAADTVAACLPRDQLEVESWLAETFHHAPAHVARPDRSRWHAAGCAVREAPRSPMAPGTPGPVVRSSAATGRATRALLLESNRAQRTQEIARWVQDRLGGRSARRVWFLEPIVMNDVQGGADLLLETSPLGADAACSGSQAADRLLGLFANPADHPSERHEAYQARLFALRLWGRHAITTSLDQVLGLLERDYRSACLLPLLVDSILVVGVEGLDQRRFLSLTRFLDTFDLPLLAVASHLSTERVERLVAAGLAVVPRASRARRADWRQTRRPRYRIAAVADAGAAKELAERALRRRARVLWVVNDVERCQALAEQLQAHDPVCYHSRFRGADRERRAAEMIRWCASDRGPLLLLASPLCEISLDLDVDVLISEETRLDALIRRMAHCRRTGGATSSLGEVFVYPIADPRIVASCRQLLDTAGRTRVLSRADLEVQLAREAWELTSAHPAAPPHRFQWQRQRDACAWKRTGLASGGEEDSVLSVLDQDVTRWRPGREDLLVPVPRALTRPDDRLPSHLRLAPASHYCARLGFRRSPPEAVARQIVSGGSVTAESRVTSLR